MKKSGRKTGKPLPSTVFKPGPDPRRGKGCKPGAPNAGRPPDEFKRLMREIASREEAIERLKKLTGASSEAPDDGIFLKAWNATADRGFGKAAQPIVSDEEGKPLSFTLKVQTARDDG